MRSIHSPSQDPQHKTLRGHLTKEATKGGTTAAPGGEAQIRSNHKKSSCSNRWKMSPRKVGYQVAKNKNNEVVHWPHWAPDVACSLVYLQPNPWWLKVTWHRVNDTDSGGRWEMLQQIPLISSTCAPISPKKACLLNSSSWLSGIVSTSNFFFLLAPAIFVLSGIPQLGLPPEDSFEPLRILALTRGSPNIAATELFMAEMSRMRIGGICKSWAWGELDW